ncbi:MAG: NifU family protein [Candidatus Omnitrophica bacterium]|nr:NifU family protein [Candidatus Omnitrophota bacterium]
MTDAEKLEKLNQIFEEIINPGVAMHGGVAELVEVKDNKVYVRFGGGCQGCSMAYATLKQGIEATIKDAIPEIEEVVDATEHGRGDNPYYEP